MSHHSGIPEAFNGDQLKDFFKTKEPIGELQKLKDMIGPTGKFPDGKINENDEGEIRIGITHDSDGKVIMNFGKPIAWIGFTKDQAKNIAANLLKHAE